MRRGIWPPHALHTLNLYFWKAAGDAPTSGMEMGMDLKHQANDPSRNNTLFHLGYITWYYMSLKTRLIICKSHYYSSSYSRSPGSQRMCLLFDWKTREVSSTTAPMKNNYRNPVLTKWRHPTTSNCIASSSTLRTEVWKLASILVMPLRWAWVPRSEVEELEAVTKNKHLSWQQRESDSIPLAGRRRRFTNSDWTWRRRWYFGPK